MSLAKRPDDPDSKDRKPTSRTVGSLGVSAMKSLLTSAVAALVFTFGLTLSARAGTPAVPQNDGPPADYVAPKEHAPKDEYVYRDGCKYKKVISYETCIKYVEREEAYTKYVTLYDHCDKPYSVKKTFYRTVEVPVKVVKPVVKYVKVCH